MPMTPKEIIKGLEARIDEITDSYDDDPARTYELCALSNAIEIVRKQIPQKIIERSKEVIPRQFIHWEECPYCHTEMEYEWGGEPYCPHCGQAVDWSEIEAKISGKSILDDIKSGKGLPPLHDKGGD